MTRTREGRTFSYTNNRRVEFQYDAAGNLTGNDGWGFSYDAEGQQASVAVSGYALAQAYDGERLRVKRVEQGVTTYYLRSTVLGGQVIAELDWQGVRQRGYVYVGGHLLALQQNGTVTWVHQDPVTKSQRVTDTDGQGIAAIDLDPWGGETEKSWNSGQQPRKYTSYERDGSSNNQAMRRQYHGYYMRFDQPDPYAGSLNLAEPQSFNRYSYVQNNPVRWHQAYYP